MIPALKAAQQEAGPDGDTVEAWRSWLRGRVANWRAVGKPLPWSISAAWGAGEVEWSKRHGTKPPVGRCAGCGKRLDIGEPMLDGALLHIGGEHGLDCMIAWGSRWRGEARDGLVSLGLNAPKDAIQTPV
jgi:hypothetical protein